MKSTHNCAKSKRILFASFMILTVGLLLVGITSVSAAEPDMKIAVIVDQENPWFITALNLDERTKFDLFTSDNISLYLEGDYTCTFLLDYTNLDSAVITHLINRVYEGMGLFFQANSPNMRYNMGSFALLSPILPIEVAVTSEGDPIEFQHTDFENINTRQQDVDHFLTDRIDFLSLPQLLNLTESELQTSALSVVESDKGLPIISSGLSGKGQVLTLAAPIRENSNEHLADWPLFTYMVFSCAMSLSGIDNYESFGDWQGSPIPHQDTRIAIILVLIAISSVSIIGFVFMKRVSKQKPLQLLPPKELNLKTPQVKSAENTLEMEVPNPSESKNTPDVQIQDGTLSSKERSWDNIGFHKPLAGFSIMFFLSLAVLLPLVIIVMYILPTFILQDPAQFGIMFITGNIFSAVFIAGDFGLAQAFDKFVGEYYIKDPKESLKYIQFFAWFQMFSGLVQTVGIALIGLYLIPNSMQVAFMSWNFVLKAFIQWPGIAYLFTHTLKAMQRTDKEQMVNLITLVIFDVAGIAVFSSLFLSVGNSDPRIGSVIGGAIGITVSEVVKTFGLLLIGGIILNKTDKRFHIGDIFRVDFDWPLAKATLIFGFKSMLSTVIFLLGNFAVTIIIMLNLPNYTYWGSFLGSATLLLYPVTFMIILYENMLPTNAEAYGAGCTRLTETYVTYGFKYAGLFGILIFFIFAFFVNSFLTTILPPLFKPMGFFIGFYAITKVFTNIGDYSRLFLVSINRIGLYVLFVSIEQIFRVALLVSLINRIDHPEYLLIWGELPGAILKVLLTWFYTNKRVMKVQINWYQSVIVPVIASMLFVLIGLALNQFYLDSIVAMGGNALIPTIVYAFVVCLGLAMTAYPFIVAFLGGWDDRSILDLEFAAKNAGPSKPFALLFLKMTRLGAAKSPLHNRFPIKVDGIESELVILADLQEKARHFQ